MRYVALVVVFLLLLAPATAAPMAVGTQDASNPGTADRATGAPEHLNGEAVSLQDAATTRIGRPRVTFAVDLRANRSARWNVSMQYPLADESDRAAFREFGQAFEAGEESGAVTVDLFRNAAATASNATGREMRIQRVERTFSVGESNGTLRLAFTWTNFLERTEEGLQLGDAFTAPDNGTWLASLGPNQRLVIAPPDGYVLDSSTYPFEDQRVVIEGPTEFGSDSRIRVSYRETQRPEPPVQDRFLLLGGGALLLGLLVVFAALRWRGRQERVEPKEPSETTEPDPAASADAATGARAKEAASEPEQATEQEQPDEDLTLLSDEERVERLLERNGGRMRQADIVDETGWSDAKVSQLLSSMAEEERVDKLRLGRENLISLPDEDGSDRVDNDRT